MISMISYDYLIGAVGLIDLQVYILLTRDIKRMKTEQLNVRLSPALLEEIDKLIESGEFGTRVEFVRYAVRMTLKSFEKRYPPPPND